jgi:hypothetical protein
MFCSSSVIPRSIVQGASFDLSPARTAVRADGWSAEKGTAKHAEHAKGLLMRRVTNPIIT